MLRSQYTSERWLKWTKQSSYGSDTAIGNVSKELCNYTESSLKRTSQKIQESMQRADARNYPRTDDELEDNGFWASLPTEGPQRLTTEEYELVESFLDC